MDMQNVSNLEIPEGEVRTIHDKDSVLLWGRVNYDTKYAGDTFQQTYSGKNQISLTPYYTGGSVYNQSAGHEFPNTTSADVTITNQDSISLSFSSTSGLQGVLLVSQSLTVGQTYTISGSLSVSDSAPRGTYYTLDSTHKVVRNVAYSTIGNISRTITIESGETYIAYGARANTGSYTATISNLQLEAGSTATSYEPFTGGQPSPSPDYPQEIQTVTGEQNVTVTGKNICSETKVENAGKNLFFRLPKLSSGDIVLSCTPGVVLTGATYGLLIDGTFTQLGTWSTNSSGKLIKSISLTAEQVADVNAGTDVWIRTYKSAGGFTNPTDAMIEYGSVSSTYEAYQSNDFPVSLTGKNLFNKDAAPKGGYLAAYSALSTGVRATATSTVNYTYLRYVMNVENYVGQTLTLSVTASASASNTPALAMGTCDSAGNNRVPKGTQAGTGELTVSYTIASGDQYIYFNFYANQVGTASVGDYADYADVQLEIGSATSYEPYFTPIELAKIGDYQDYIYKSGDDWYVHKETGSVTYDGTETWSVNTTSKRASVNKPSNWVSWGTSEATYRSKGFCTHLLAGSSSPSAGLDNVFNVGTNSVFIRAINYGTATSITAWVTWLSSNNITCYSILETPTDTKITDATLISQLEALHEWMVRYGYYGTVSGNLPMIIKRTALS